MFKTADCGELESKNFWRIVGEADMESYQKLKDTAWHGFLMVEITELVACNRAGTRPK